jgi:hypothetical protein
MILGKCTHCAAPIKLVGNLGSLLLGSTYFCSHCGHPGPGLITMVSRRLRSRLSRDGDSAKLSAEDQTG